MDVRQIQFVAETQKMMDLDEVQELIAKEKDVIRASILSYRASELQAEAENAKA